MSSTVPTHVGYILDGNRRWARSHSIPEFDGHLAGYNALREVLETTYDAGVKYVSIYAFSTENWKRDEKEVSNIMKLAVHAISSDLKRMVKDRVQVRFLGSREGIGSKLLAGIEKAEQATGMFTDKVLAVCFNYGGQQEIAAAVRQCMEVGLAAEDITEQAIADHLYAPDIPPVDLVVRTSGEQRLSNFMLWRTAYSEFVFLDKFWPDMQAEDVRMALSVYAARKRRYGG
jgi:undecaprenyl diphosphate synthase